MEGGEGITQASKVAVCMEVHPGAPTVWGGTAHGACVAASAHTASGLGREETAGQEHGALTMWGGISVEQENLLHKSQDFKNKKERFKRISYFTEKSSWQGSGSTTRWRRTEGWRDLFAWLFDLKAGMGKGREERLNTWRPDNYCTSCGGGSPVLFLFLLTSVSPLFPYKTKIDYF